MAITRKTGNFANECWSLSDAAYRLHDEGLIWSNEKLLNCRIPKEDIQRFKRPEAVQELLDKEWWDEDGDVYVIRHHANVQRGREQVLAQQAANVTNGRKGGRPRKNPPETQSVSKTQSVSTPPETQMETGSRTQSVSEDPSETQMEADWVSPNSGERSTRYGEIYPLPTGGGPGEPAADAAASAETPAKPKRKTAKQAEPHPRFEEFWKVWPRNDSKAEARKKFSTAVKNGNDPDAIISAAKKQVEQFRREGREARYVPYASTWLNQSRFDDDMDSPSLLLVSGGDSPWGGSYAGPVNPFARDMGWRR